MHNGHSHLFPVYFCVASGCVNDFQASRLFVSSQVTFAEVSRFASAPGRHQQEMSVVLVSSLYDGELFMELCYFFPPPRDYHFNAKVLLEVVHAVSHVRHRVCQPRLKQRSHHQHVLHSWYLVVAIIHAASRGLPSTRTLLIRLPLQFEMYAFSGALSPLQQHCSRPRCSTCPRKSM